jgi:PQQ-dependent catabolism-associated beta-propeller protein
LIGFKAKYSFEEQKFMNKAWKLCGLLLAFGSAASAFAQGTAFVTSEKDHVVTAVSLKDLKVTGTTPTCKRPRHMQRSPDGKSLMIACSDDNMADVIDIATLKSVNRIPLGDDPEIFDLSPDGKTLYVSNEDDAQLSMIDIATKKKVATVKVGQEPEGVKVSRDGKIVYVASEVANLVHVVDVESKKILKNIPVGKRPRRFAFNADGSQLWVSNELDASVSVIATKDHQVIDTIRFKVKGARATDITPVGVLMSGDGKRAYVALGRANHVAFVETATRKVTNLVLAGKRAWSLGLNKDESRLFVVNGLSDDMTVIDTQAAKAISSIAVGRVPHSVVVVD